ncbi:uncharacterized protein LOC116416633 [Nasonia vitripennis]|uniref:Uncharacterized protein n=1 Tax=Nasonia vitripennis TaxID=7425 RepID=A0A7M7Q4F0_NASVI|nr:uncharacterized protein LOC116416633 [Nasonia vitripennis]
MDHYEIVREIAELGHAYIEYNEIIRRRRRLRRWWSKPLIRHNYLTGYGSYRSVFTYFKLNDEEEFIQFTRMNVQAFDYLYTLVHAALIKRSIRPALPPELRLSLTLNYLAHGDSIIKHKWFYSIGMSTTKSIVPEVCNVGKR